jgi:5-methylcytosine-specific restriction endonuclease McrA
MRTNTAPLKTARWAEVRAMVAHRASFRCEHCHTFLGMTGQADHVIPRGTCEMLGIGVYDPKNLQFLCSSCHSQKSNRERWAGHERKPPKQHTRSNLPGRDKFLDAAGIPQPERN